MNMKGVAWVVVVGALFAAWPVSAEQDCRDVMGTYSVPVQAVAGVIAASNVVVYITAPSCTQTATDTFNLGLDANGPLTVGAIAVTYAWTVAAITGCTGGTLVQTTLNTAASNNDGSYLPITMTSNYCRGVIRLLVNVPGLGNIVVARLPWDTMVMNTAISNTVAGTIDTQARLCAASALGSSCTTPALSAAITSWPSLNIGSLPTVNIAGSLTTTIAAWPSLSVGITSWPNLNIASMPTITVNDQVHILDAVTLHHIIDSGTITVEGLNFTAGDVNITMPMNLAVQLCGPDFIDTGICTPVEIHGSGEVSQAGDVALFFPLLLFAVLVIWAEIKGHFELYCLAALVGLAVVIGLWPAIEGMRFALVAILVFLAWRAYNAARDNGDD